MSICTLLRRTLNRRSRIVIGLIVEGVNGTAPVYLFGGYADQVPQGAADVLRTLGSPSWREVVGLLVSFGNTVTTPNEHNLYRALLMYLVNITFAERRANDEFYIIVSPDDDGSNARVTRLCPRQDIQLGKFSLGAAMTDGLALLSRQGCAGN